MSSIQAQPTIQAPATVQGTASSAIAVVVKSPAAFIKTVSLGQALQGTTQSPTNANQVQVQTPLGTLTLQTAMALPKGAVLTLVLTSLSPASFQIGMVDGKPIPGSLTAAQAKTAGIVLTTNSATSTPAPSTSSSNPAISNTPIQSGSSHTATLLRPTQSMTQGLTPSIPGVSRAASQPGLTGTTPSTSTGSTPANSGTVAPNASSARMGQTAMGSGNTSPQTSSGSGSQVYPVGSRFTLSVQRITAPNSAVSTPPTQAASAQPLSPGSTVTGTVIGRTPVGQPIVQTPTSTFSLNTTSGLADGSKITFKLETLPLPPAPNSQAQSLSKTGHGLGLIHAKTWDDLGDALKTLAVVDPARLQQMAQTVLPQPGAKLTNQILFFMSALKGGDLSSIFGDTALRLIDKERPGLVNRLGGDFHAMSKLIDDPQSGDWRLALIPLWTGERLEQIRLYHRDAGEPDENGEPDGARFVLDLELSNIGHLQIDGFMQPADKRLGLILRTNEPLPKSMRADIALMAQAAEQILGLSAAVSFQAKPANFIDFSPASPTAEGLIA